MPSKTLKLTHQMERVKVLDIFITNFLTLNAQKLLMYSINNIYTYVKENIWSSYFCIDLKNIH